MSRNPLVLVLVGSVAGLLPGRAEASGSKSAIVIVVENNDEAEKGGSDLWLRALDGLGEPLYADLLARTASRYWNKVVVLSDSAASFDSFAATARELDGEGYTIDVVLDIHGSSKETELGNRTTGGPDKLYFAGRPVTADEVAALGKPEPLRLNAVYMVACWGGRFGEAWLEAGARAANGADELNYYVLLSPLAFIESFGRGTDLETAAREAFGAEARLLDRDSVDRLLAPLYGKRGVERIQGARSSRRVQTGPSVKAACCAPEAAPEPKAAEAEPKPEPEPAPEKPAPAAPKGEVRRF